MRTIDIETWSRRDTFRLFSTFDLPHFGLTAPVDLTAFRPAVKQRGLSFTVAITYIVSRAANEIPEFRYRIHGNTVVEHERAHPSITLLTGDDQLSFCWFEYDPDFRVFVQNAMEEIARIRANPTLTDPGGRDDFLFMTAIPWVSFTDLLHPMIGATDSVPRFAWGKYHQQGDRLQMPLNVQVHHALLDGVHVSKFFLGVQNYLDDPDAVLDGA
jgi:chloramphenicol O-acetyltransferase type A